jgi:N4-gp56 family major capsid protein
MANTQTIDALRQELWSKELMDDVMLDVKGALQFVGEGANNVVQVSRELAKRKGDTETFGLVTRLSGDGVTGDDELEGNEEAMSSYAEQVAIDQIRHAVRLKGKLDNQKVLYNQIEKARENLRIWLKEFKCNQIMMKLAGVTNTTLTNVNGRVVGTRALWSNTPDYIPDADEAAGVGNRYLCIEVTGTDGLADADIMTLDFVTKLKTKAKLTEPKIQPLEIDGQPYYVHYLHPLQVRDLKLSSDWKTANQNARERSARNPVFTGVLGEWDGVLLVESEFVPWLDISVAGNSFRGAATGTDCTADAARSLFCGRQAALMAEASNPEALTVERFDYGNKDGVAISFIGGIQKAMFNSKEFGVIAGDTGALV